MNDPNGFPFITGNIIFFISIIPYESKWGSYALGPCGESGSSPPGSIFQRLMAPDEAYDRDGCFSGSAVALPDGRHLLMYTGVVRQRQDDGEYRIYRRSAWQ